ncbi:glycosyltransferase [Pseudomonas tolaasii]|uniref:glycosyltransferase n=1 Tax=Pseudomonas tolaasii TaxID=29442 RepID=UPI0015A39A45|nr:glycosyltransferase [Pseudomonas tolaasii]MBW1248163.1 glycosyltransferase [Pseudomonas tolaasii]MBW4795766.1 glycosyltransferase [Pseudomonas tolaasii]NVZ44369.1 glycosyltransferase [Pseudomonas tolaasii]NWA47230.1 glycosyltransferase [Pseudomonas tolaasii]
MKPTVSVIMPTYNHAPFVEQAIRSVLSQRDVDFELLVSDDGSSDTTRDVVASIKDERITFFPNTVNRGACVVTNELIQRSSGEFIALINSDDHWSVDDKLAYQVKILREYPTIGATFGRARFVDKHDVPMDKSSFPTGSVFDQDNRSQGLWLRRFFDLGNCICHPTMLIRKACYDDVGLYSNRMRQLPDFDMWVKVVKKYDIHVSEHELINFRIMPGENASSQTATNSIRTINEHYLIAESFFDNVSAKVLIEGFSDILVCKDVPTQEHVDIESALLFFNHNQWLGAPYKMIGLLKLNALLNSPAHFSILKRDYSIDDRWFQAQMGEIDVLRPKMVAVIGEKTLGARQAFKKFFKS